MVASEFFIEKVIALYSTEAWDMIVERDQRTDEATMIAPYFREIKTRSGIYCFMADKSPCSRERKYDFQPREKTDESVILS